MKKIFTEDLPKKGDKIDWKRSEGHTIHFIYEDVEGEILIKQKIDNDFLLIQYNNIDFKLRRVLLMRCALGSIIGQKKHEVNFKYSVEEEINKNKVNLLILDRKTETRKKKSKKCKNGSSISTIKLYKCKCKICNNIDWIKEEEVENGCKCCNTKSKIAKGVNDIATTDPWMIPYFKNKEDVYTHSHSSREYSDMVCPLCGKEKNYRIDMLYYKHTIGCNCKDGLFYTEKLVGNVLDNLKVNYITQLNKKHFSWCENKKYDFYFKLNEEEYIIETHGGQHYKKGFERCGGRTLEEEQKNDQYKYNLAVYNGIKPENYIVIDCRKSELEWIKNSILNSRLNEIFNLDNINWEECHKNSLKNIVKEVCDYWHKYVEVNKDYLTTTDLSNIFNLDSKTIRKYLIQGVKCGWCKYNAKKERTKIQRHSAEIRKENNKRREEEMKKVMTKPEYLQLIKEELEERTGEKVTKISIERAFEIAGIGLEVIGANLDVEEKAEVMGIKIERVPVKAREGVMERPDGERIPFKTEEGSKVVVKALKALKEA